MLWNFSPAFQGDVYTTAIYVFFSFSVPYNLSYWCLFYFYRSFDPISDKLLAAFNFYSSSLLCYYHRCKRIWKRTSYWQKQWVMNVMLEFDTDWCDLCTGDETEVMKGGLKGWKTFNMWLNLVCLMDYTSFNPLIRMWYHVRTMLKMVVRWKIVYMSEDCALGQYVRRLCIGAKWKQKKQLIGLWKVPFFVFKSLNGPKTDVSNPFWLKKT